MFQPSKADRVDMESSSDSGSYTLENLSALGGLLEPESIPQGGPARRRGFAVRTQHAYQSAGVVQRTHQVDPYIVAVPYDLYGRSSDAPKLEPPRLRPELLETATPGKKSDRHRGQVSGDSTLNRSQLTLLLEVPERNAELLDSRERTVIPIVSGEHKPVCLRDFRTLGIDSSSLIVLSYLGLLGRALSAFEHIKFPPNIMSHLRAQRNDVKLRYPALVRAADEILGVIDAAIQAGRASFASASTGAWGTDRCDSHSQTAISLIARANECDVICVDDARYNCQSAILATNNREVPVSCVTDLLRMLRETDRVSENEYWLTRHKLRQGCFAVLLPEPDELHHWLKASKHHNESLVECLELRIIRQAMGYVAQTYASSLRESLEVAITAAEACIATVNCLWEDKSISCDEAAVLSNWVWLHASPLYICSERFKGGTNLDASRPILVATIAQMLMPISLPASRQKARTKWIEDAIMPCFEPANMEIADSALDLVVQTISREDRDAEFLGGWFLAQVPESLRNRFLEKHPDLGNKWGFEMRRQIFFDSEFSVASKDLIATARQAYARGTAVELEHGGERPASLRVDEDSQNALIDWTDSCGRRVMKSVPHLALLSRSAEVRVARVRELTAKLGATSNWVPQLIADLESRPATDGEMDQISFDFSNGVKGTHDQLYRNLSEIGEFSIDDILPPILTYFDRFVGPVGMDCDVEEYLYEVLIPYRKELFNVDLKSGLEIACLGFLRDDLAPGEWLRDVDIDAVWDALESCNFAGSPIALLGALDIALYRQNDLRFCKFARDAVSKLLDESLGRSDGFDSYAVFSILAELLLNGISTLESGSVQPGYWRRMGAWMQAGLFVNYLARCQIRLDVNQLQEFSGQNKTIGGFFAGCVDARIDGLVLATRTVPELLRLYALQRLATLRWRHESLGHRVPALDGVESPYWRRRDNTVASTHGLPGPLDGHRAPTEPLPSEWGSAITTDLSRGADGFPWQKFVTSSQLHAMGNVHIDACRANVSQLGEAELHTALRGIGYASFVASASRDNMLADAIADTVQVIATRATEPRHVRSVLGSLLQAGAVHVDNDIWADWLERRLVEIAQRLPPPPSAVSRMFRDCLDELASILPINAWIHLRARSIAACIAPSSPAPEDSLPNGWLEESLKDLEGLREEAMSEGSDEPTEISLRSARGFLKALATVIHQSPYVELMADATIGIDFRNQTMRGGVLFVVERDGSGACYTLVNGGSKQFVRARCEELLDDEIRTAVTAAGVG